MYDFKTHRKMEKILQIRAIWAKKNTIDIKIAQNYYDVKYVECSFMDVQQFFKALKGTMNLKYILCVAKLYVGDAECTRETSLFFLLFFYLFYIFHEKSIF